MLHFCGRQSDRQRGLCGRRCLNSRYPFRSQESQATHAAAIAATLRNLLVRMAKQYASQFAQRSGARLQLLKNFTIRRIEPVSKAPHDQPLDKFQTGTWIAHKLCSLEGTIRSGTFKRIIHMDMSNVVRKTVQQFDGKSFYLRVTDASFIRCARCARSFLLCPGNFNLKSQTNINAVPRTGAFP